MLSDFSNQRMYLFTSYDRSSSKHRMETEEERRLRKEKEREEKERSRSPTTKIKIEVKDGEESNQVCFSNYSDERHTKIFMCFS